MSHSPEPWKTFPYTGPVPAFRMHSVTTADGDFILAVGGPDSETAIANLNRIVACINLLRGISTEDLNLLYNHPMYHCNALDDIRSAIDGAKARPCSPAEFS